MGKKRTAVIIGVVLLILALCGFTAVLQKSNAAYEGVWHRKVSLDEAEKLVRAHIFEEVPEMNPNVEVHLAEVTKEEVWKKIGAQIFVWLDGPRTYTYYLVRDGLVDTLGIFSIMAKSNAFCVTDLDRNGKNELIYTRAWGSGSVRSEIYAYIRHNKLLESDMIGFVGELYPEKQGNYAVSIKARKLFFNELEEKVLIGRVTLEKVGGELKLLYHEDKNIPYEMKRYYLDSYHKN